MPNESEEIKPQAPKELLPEEVENYYEKGIEAIKRGNFDYAVELFNSALALKQDFAAARFYLWAALREKQKRSADPLKIMTLLRKIANFFISLQGISLKKRGKNWEAVYQLEKAMRIDPSSTQTLLAMAECFLSEGQKPNAIKMLEAVVQIDNRNKNALRKLGDLYLEIQDYEKARAYYKATLKVDPYDMDAERGLKNLDALKTLQKSFQTEDQKDKPA